MTTAVQKTPTTDNGDQTSNALSVMRIYLPRRYSRANGFWRRMFPQPLYRYLAEEALKAGVTYASTSLGHAGFVQKSAFVSADMAPEIQIDTLPTCLELVGDRGVLEAFARSHADDLKGSTIALFEGVEVRA